MIRSVFSVLGGVCVGMGAGLVLGAGNAQAELSEELQSLDIAAISHENAPNWSVPEPIQRERGPVVVEELIERLGTGHHLYAKYLYHAGQWHWLGIRVIMPADIESGQRIHQLGSGRYENVTLEDLRADDGFAVFNTTTPCTDDPESMAPTPLNPLPGEERDVRWTNPYQECDYEASFRYSSADGGETWSWLLISFEYTFTGDIIGSGDGGDDDEQ